MNKIFILNTFFISFYGNFALTIPVFSNLFYDKLVPSASVSSLFGVAIIVAVFIVLSLSFVLRKIFISLSQQGRMTSILISHFLKRYFIVKRKWQIHVISICAME